MNGSSQHNLERSAICGLVFDDGRRRASRAVLERMLTAFPHPASDGSVQTAGSAGLGSTKQPEGAAGGDRGKLRLSDAGWDHQSSPNRTAACWDHLHGKLTLYTEWSGLSPLYYAPFAGGLVFGSRIEALFASGFVQPALNRAAVAEQVQFSFVRGASTFFAGVYKLLPASVLEYQQGDMRIRPYWSPHRPVDHDKSREAWLLQIRQLMAASVAGVWVRGDTGLLLSGGIDSAWVLATAAKQFGPGIPTFSAGFDSPGFNELPAAERMAESVGARQHSLMLRERDYADLLLPATHCMEEPLVHPDSPAVLALCRLASSEVHKIVTGSGSDTLFGGSITCLMVEACRQAPRLTAMAGSLLHLPVFRSRRRLQMVGDLLSAGYPHAAGYVNLKNGASLLADLGLPPVQHYGIELPPNVDGFHGSMLWDLADGNISELLKISKIASTLGLNSAMPYLDQQLAETTSQIPVWLLFSKRLEAKAILKAAAAADLPAAVIRRRKVGFATPTSAWFRSSRGPLGQMLDCLMEPRSRDRGLFRPAEVQRLIREHRAGLRNHGNALEMLLYVELWARLFLDGAGASAANPPMAAEDFVPAGGLEALNPSSGVSG